MAVKDLSGQMLNNQKRGVRVIQAKLPYNLPGTGNQVVSGDSYILGKIPAGSLVKSIYSISRTPYNSATTATINVGTSIGGKELVDSFNLKSAANTTTAGIAGATGKFIPVDTIIYATPALAGTTSDGEYWIAIEVEELFAKTGEYFS